MFRTWFKMEGSQQATENESWKFLFSDLNNEISSSYRYSPSELGCLQSLCRNLPKEYSHRSHLGTSTCHVLVQSRESFGGHSYIWPDQSVIHTAEEILDSSTLTFALHSDPLTYILILASSDLKEESRPLASDSEHPSTRSSAARPSSSREGEVGE